MAAQTGTTSLPIRPSRRKTGAEVRNLPEFSALTHPIGAMLIRTAGSFKANNTAGFAQSTGIIGFAVSTGQNVTTTTVSGQPTAAFFAARHGQVYEGVLNTTWSAATLRGATAGLSANSLGKVVVGTAAGASSCLTIIDAKDWDNGAKVLDGDVFPVVYFVLADAAIADAS